MRRSAIVVRTLALLPLLSLFACGGDDGGTDPPPAPTAESMAAVGTTSLQGTTWEAFDVEVEVTGSDGEPFAGTTVQWAVTSGDGTVDASTSVSAASGRAGVSWTLGPLVGTQSLVATAGGLGSITFTATAELGTLEPSSDVTISGDLTVQRVTIPAGVTVTVAGRTTIDSEGAVTVTGILAGDCQELTIVGAEGVIIGGLISNECVSEPNQVGPPLSITGDGPLTVTGDVASSGEVLIRNSPDITPEQIRGVAAKASGASSRAASAIDACTFDGADFLAPPGAVPEAGAGSDGQPGVDWLLGCSGDALFTGAGSTASAGPGGDGGEATGGSTDLSDPAGEGSRGGDGGAGGGHYVLAQGSVTFDGWTFDLPRGGDGHGHEVVAVQPGRGAVATAGAGGVGGPLRVTAGTQLVVTGDGLDVESGAGGMGAEADATGADGTQATTSPAGDGGEAAAHGGGGGATSEISLESPAGISGGVLIQVMGAAGGRGGDALASGGSGGDGSSDQPDAGDGGAMSAVGGLGGTAGVGGIGGDGGWIHLSGGEGGDGYAFCAEGVIEPGGDGGRGGSASGSPGLGAFGGPAVPGDDGRVAIAARTGTGGEGGAGTPLGEGGDAGEDDIAEGFERTTGNEAFASGSDGERCNRNPVLLGVSIDAGREAPVPITLPYSDPDGDLPKLVGPPGLEAGIVEGLEAGEGSILAGSWSATENSVSFTFQSAPGFSGTAHFTVAILDELDGVSEPADVSISLTNTAPVFNDGQGDLTVVVARSDEVTFDLPFQDPDGDEMVFAYAQTPAHGTVTDPLPSGTSGPSVTYSHDGNFDTDVFSVEATDIEGSGGAAVELTTLGTVQIIIVDNAAPACVPIADMDMVAGQNLTIPVSVTDSDSDPNGFTFEFLSGADGPQNGMVTFLGGTGLSRTVRYSPDPGFSGQDGFTVRVMDPVGHVVECSATIFVLSGETVLFTTGSSVAADGIQYFDPVAGTLESGPGAAGASGLSTSPDGMAVAILHSTVHSMVRFNLQTRVIDPTFGFSGFANTHFDGVDIARRSDGSMLLTRSGGRMTRYAKTEDFDPVDQGSTDFGDPLADIFLSSDESRVAVIQRNGTPSEDKLLILDATSLSGLATVDLPSLVDVVLTPDRGKVWVSNLAGGGVQLSLYDLSSLQVVRTHVLTGAGGGGISLTPDGTRIFVLEPDVGSERVHVLDAETGAATEAAVDLPVDVDLAEVFETADGYHRIFLGHERILVHDLRTGTYLVPGGTPLPVGADVVEALLLEN